MSTQLSLSDFFVLSLLVESSPPVYKLLENPAKVSAFFNCRHPGIDQHEISTALERIVSRGWAAACEPPACYVPPRLPRNLPSCNIPMHFYCKLTSSGGVVWEQIARPDWDRYESVDLEAEGEYTCTATTERRLSEIPFLMEYSLHGHFSWIGATKRVGQWEPLYWRKLSNGYCRRARFTPWPSGCAHIYTSDDRTLFTQLNCWIRFGFSSCETVVAKQNWEDVRVLSASM